MKIANKGKPATVDLGSDVCSHSLLLGANDSVPELFLDTRFAIPELYLGVPNLARDSPKSRLGLTQFPIVVVPKSRSLFTQLPIDSTQFRKGPDPEMTHAIPDKKS